MAEIAEAAGLSVGQIYRYFESKEAIVAAIADQDLAEMRDKFAEFESGERSITDRIVDLCPQAIDHHYDLAHAALALEVLAEAARNPRVAVIVQKADACERQLVSKLLDDVCTDCTPAEKAARGEVLSMIFDGMVTRAVNNPDGDRAAISQVLREVMRLLLAPAPLSPANTSSSGEELREP
jgi:AcrR family transcriptional regulator